MKNKKLLMMASALVLGASTLTSCGSSKNDLKVWCATEDVQFVEQRIEAFKQANTQYKDKKISVVVTAESDSATALKNDPKASADVLHFAGDQVGMLVRQNLLYEFSANDVKDLGIDCLSAGQVGGKQYGIPFTPNTFFMYYDASVYSAEDVKSFSAMLTKFKADNKGYQYAFGLDICNGWYLQSYYFSAGCTIYGADGEQVTDGIKPVDKALKATEWVYDYYNNSALMAGDPGANIGVNVAAGVTGTWNADKIKTAITSAGGTYAAAPLPKVDFLGNGNELTWKSVGDYKQIGVNSVTKQPELAMDLAIFLANKDSQVKRYEMRKTAPTNTQATADPSITWDEAIIAQTAQAANTFKQPTKYGDTGFWDAATALGSDIQTCKAKAEVADYFDSFITTITPSSQD